MSSWLINADFSKSGQLDCRYSNAPSSNVLILFFRRFVRQLEVDQESCLKPDYVKPFRTKDEAVKRLIR